MPFEQEAARIRKVSVHRAALVMSALWGSLAFGAAPPQDVSSWVPARWEGGPLEIKRRAGSKFTIQSARVREAIEKWYQPSTLALLEGTPINCLLLSLSGGTLPEVESKQQTIVKEYARLARGRGIAVLGIVYPGADPAAVAQSSSDAQLDGLVLDGDFPAGFASRLGERLVIPILPAPAAMAMAQPRLVAVQGTHPGARDLAESGIRAGASAEPWVESNIWLVNAVRAGATRPAVWIDQKPDPSSIGIYARSVADAAIAGGHWIVTLDDDLRGGLYNREAKAMASWQTLSASLRFAEEHAAWRSFIPFGNVAVVFDAARHDDFENEYLNLIARRHVPYRLVERAAVSPDRLKEFKAAVVPELEHATEAERATLRYLAENGGALITGPWLQAPNTPDHYEEIPTGKGRIVVFKEDPPDPETLARDLQDLLEPELLGVSVFNVPSAITFVTRSESARQMLVQLLNYATVPTERVTVRLNGLFKRARLYTPSSAPLDLSPRSTENGRTEVLIPRISGWGALIIE